MTISEALLARWRRVPTAVVADITGGACQLDPDIRPLRPAGQQPALFGRALTAECPPADIGAVIGALELAKRGDVLVIAAGGHRHTATIGEILGGYLRARGAAGIICDGAVRDVGALGTWDDFSVRTIGFRGFTALGACFGKLITLVSPRAQASISGSAAARTSGDLSRNSRSTAFSSPSACALAA